MGIEKQSTAIKGGKRPGAGRKAGVPNKRTAAVIEAVEASGVTPLDYMLDVMRNPANDAAMRLDAAKSAAGYVHAKLSAVDVKATVVTKTLDQELAELNAAAIANASSSTALA